MSNKIYLDCGGHFGEGLEVYIKHYNMDDTWNLFSFEPNNDSFEKLISNSNIKLKVNYIKKAVWVYNGVIKFNAEYPPDSDVSDGEGSSLIDLDYWKPKSDFNPGAGDVFSSYDVECIDISNFILNNFEIDDFILLKMDIEGAEFDVLRKMIDDRSIVYINDLYIEFHDFCYLRENEENKNKIIKDIQEKNKNINIYGSLR